VFLSPSRCTDKGCCRRIERVVGRLFEGEEAVLHVMGVQIASEKRRNPWTLPATRATRAGIVGSASGVEEGTCVQERRVRESSRLEQRIRVEPRGAR